MMDIDEIELASTNSHRSIPTSFDDGDAVVSPQTVRRCSTMTKIDELDGLMKSNNNSNNLNQRFDTEDGGGCYCSRRVIALVALVWIVSTLAIAYSLCHFTNSILEDNNVQVYDNGDQNQIPSAPPASAPTANTSENDNNEYNLYESTSPPSALSSHLGTTTDTTSTTNNNVPNNVSCKNCCQGGNDSCKYNLGSIEDNSCNGDGSCQYNTGEIKSGSCNGAGSCTTNTGIIESNACNEMYTCTDNISTVGSDSCLSLYACRQNQGTIGISSCSTGHYACDINTGQIGNDSCSGGLYVCAYNPIAIGDHACNLHVERTYACAQSKQDIPNGFIPTLPPSTTSEIQTEHSVTCNNCCEGIDACKGNTGTIGNDSCNGRAACLGNTGSIGNNSCTKSNSCLGNVGVVGDNSCTSNDSCVYNSGTIHNNSCQAAQEKEGSTSQQDQGNGVNVCNDNTQDIPSNACNAIPQTDPICYGG